MTVTQGAELLHQISNQERILDMVEMNIQIPVENIAGMINSMDPKELETLCVLLSEQGKELIDRKNDIETESVQLLSREETFDV